MRKFNSIESLRHVVKRVRGHAEYNGIEIPTIPYVGTVKLHGTNAGIRITNGEIFPQSRERELSIESDNFGFAAFVLARKEWLLEFMRFNELTDATIYGEWIGKGIQKSVGISELPRHFVIFAVFNHNTGRYEKLDDLSISITDFDRADQNLPTDFCMIDEISTYEVEINFNDPQPAADLITQYTLEVERKCPWAARFGIEGTGEGIVWVPAIEEFAQMPELWFKSKGLEHKQNFDKTKNVKVDVEKINEINALVDTIVPQWRLEQGIQWMLENNHIVDIKGIGTYIKWVNQDTVKEEQDTILASGIEWKQIAKVVTYRARKFYMDHLDREGGLS